MPDRHRAPGRRSIYALLAANGISTLGTRMSFLAIPWFVLSVTGSAAATGLVVFAEMAPYVLVQGLGGPLVDRLGAWRVAIVSELVAGIAMAGIPLLHAENVLGLPLLAAAVGVAGAVRGAGDTGNRVLVPALAEGAAMPFERASGLFDGISRLASMLGIPLAGVLILLVSAPGVIVVDAATFAISGALIALAVPRSAEPAPHPDESEAGYLRRLAQGFAYLRGDRLLTGVAIMVLVTNLLDAAQASVFMPVWGQEVLGSPVGVGIVGGLFGLGAVSGNATLTWLAPRLPRRAVYAWGFLLAGAPRYVALALFSTVPPVAAIAFVAGFGAGSINPILGAVEYERVPRHLQARVLGVVGALAWAGIPFGGLLGGALVEASSLTTALFVAAAIYLAATLAPFIFPVWRQMNRPSPPPVSSAPVPQFEVDR
jgi:MFS family permease